MILASPKQVQLTEEYDFPQKSVQRLSCAMAVEVVPLSGCTLCSSRKSLHGTLVRFFGLQFLLELQVIHQHIHSSE